MDAGLAAPAAEPLRSPRLVALVLAVPSVAYVVWALVPWLRGTLAGPDGGNGVAVLCAMALFLGSAVGLAAGASAVVTRQDRRATWAVLALLSAGALIWLATPAGTAILTAAVD